MNDAVTPDATEALSVLVVDDSPDFLLLIRRQIMRGFPAASVSVHNPVLHGRPGDDFDWSEFDCLVLDYELGNAESGLDWLRDYHAAPGFPVTIFLTASSDAYVVAKAMKYGADDYLSKHDLNPERLCSVIGTAVRARRRERGEASTVAPAPVPESGPGAALHVPGYRLGARIGRGATSDVFLAERDRDHLTVVVKVLHPHLLDEGMQIERFVREAELVSKLDSPHVVKVYDQGFRDDIGFLVLEFLPRGDLKHRMDEGLGPDDALACLTDIALGLDAIHGIGVVHRDLKPGNIMFRHDDTLVIADFGLSRRMDSTLELTISGQVLGTPSYMSPEQAQGLPAGPRSDLYSAGIVFYELLTRHKPFTANNITGILLQHVSEPPPALPEHVARFQPIIDSLLAKDPEQRPANATALVKLLSAY